MDQESEQMQIRPSNHLVSSPARRLMWDEERSQYSSTHLPPVCGQAVFQQSLVNPEPLLLRPRGEREVAVETKPESRAWREKQTSASFQQQTGTNASRGPRAAAFSP